MIKIIPTIFLIFVFSSPLYAADWTHSFYKAYNSFDHGYSTKIEGSQVCVGSYYWETPGTVNWGACVTYPADYVFAGASKGTVYGDLYANVIVSFNAPPPAEDALCTDGLKNPNETGIDCGGVCSSPCNEYCPSGMEKRAWADTADSYFCAYSVESKNSACPAGYMLSSDGSECYEILTIQNPVHSGYTPDSTHFDAFEPQIDDNPWNIFTEETVDFENTTTEVYENGSSRVLETTHKTTVRDDGTTYQTTFNKITFTNPDGSSVVIETETNTGEDIQGQPFDQSITTTNHYDIDGNLTSTDTQTTGDEGDINSYSNNYYDPEQITADGQMILYGLNQVVNTNEIIADELSGQGDDLSGMAGDINTIKNAVTGDTQGVKTSVDAVKSSVDGLGTSLDSIDGSVNAVSGQLVTIGNSIDSVGSSVDGVKNSVDVVNTSVGSLAGNIDGVKGSVDGLGTKIDGVKDSVNDVQLKLNDTNQILLNVEDAILGDEYTPVLSDPDYNSEDSLLGSDYQPTASGQTIIDSVENSLSLKNQLKWDQLQSSDAVTSVTDLITNTTLDLNAPSCSFTGSAYGKNVEFSLCDFEGAFNIMGSIFYSCCVLAGILFLFGRSS